jgi:hypothetical protein
MKKTELGGLDATGVRHMQEKHHARLTSSTWDELPHDDAQKEGSMAEIFSFRRIN